MCSSTSRLRRPPVGELRFAAPKYPAAIKDKNGVQDSSYGPNCIQAVAKADVPSKPAGASIQNEDRLFFDVYVPAHALEPDTEPLSVVVWIHGGPYIFSTKDAEFALSRGPFSAYDGQGFRDFWLQRFHLSDWKLPAGGLRVLGWFDNGRTGSV